LRNVENLDAHKPMLNSHCSVLIKVTPDKQTLLASHDTWAGFTTMLRTYKHYTMNFANPANLAPSMSLSSYPLCLMSTDDFYITSQQLVIMETTNDVFNQSLYQFVTPQTVPYWVRITVASRMASTGPEWVQWFSMFNSGTYNNQWQVVDYKLFTPGQALQPNTLWIAEQIPGWVVSADQTSSLDSTAGQGYWPSYNVPFFPFVYNISGYTQFKSNAFSYEHCPRANIFRRDQNNVVDMPSFQQMMRYNQFQTDPLANRNACNGISSRCDLNTPFVTKSGGGPYAPFGGIDCKTTDNIMQATQSALAVAGPTWQSQPPFAWTQEWPTSPHYGHATVFAFDFELMMPFVNASRS